MTLSERIDKTYELATEMGLTIKAQEEGEAARYRAFTKADARALVEAEDKKNEEALERRESVKTSYGVIKVVHRKERIGRNPKTKEEITIPAKDVLKCTTYTAFLQKLNPGLSDK